MSHTMFEIENHCIALDQITRVEKKRDGGVTAHFPGSDFVMIPKQDCLPFLQAYRDYHAWKSGIKQPVH